MLGPSNKWGRRRNILVCEVEQKMRLCDFGSAAAMGREGRTGYPPPLQPVWAYLYSHAHENPPPPLGPP